MFETLRRCYGDLTSFLLQVNHNAEPQHTLSAYSSVRRRMAFYNVQGNFNATDEDALALLQNCRRLYCMYLGDLHYFREDAVSVWQGFKYLIYTLLQISNQTINTFASYDNHIFEMYFLYPLIGICLCLCVGRMKKGGGCAWVNMCLREGVWSFNFCLLGTNNWRNRKTKGPQTLTLKNR